MSRHYLVRQARGPAWDPARGRREQAGWEQHAAFVDRLIAERKILIGGPVEEEDGEVTVLVVAAADEAAARALFDADPWRDRLLRIESAERWNVWVGAERIDPIGADRIDPTAGAAGAAAGAAGPAGAAAGAAGAAAGAANAAAGAAGPTGAAAGAAGPAGAAAGPASAATGADGHLALARAMLGLLCLVALVLGVLAAFAPRTFYDDFPFFAHWVELLPPYNEHLVTDVGGLYLALAVIFGWAAWTLQRTLVRAACAGFLLAAVLHLIFHASHLERFGTADGIAEIALLAALLPPPLIAIWAVEG